jgi:hypothetical protein
MTFVRFRRPPHVAAGELWCRATVLDCGGVPVARWVEAGLGSPDLAVVERLVRAHLVAQRRGGRLVLDEISASLALLLDLVGVCG